MAAPGQLEESLLAMYRRIDALMPEERSPVVAFMGVPNSADSSRLVNLLAKAVTTRLRRNVLLINSEARIGRRDVMPPEMLRELVRPRRSRARADAVQRPVGIE